MNAMLEEIEARRREIDVPVYILERAAGVSFNYYRFLRDGRYQGSTEVMRRLEMALSRLAAGQDGAADALVEKDRAMIRLAIALLCERQGLDGAMVQGMRPEQRASGSPLWLQGSRVRGEAWALVNGVFGLRGVDIARAAGVSKAAVSVALRKVEEKREEAAYDGEMSRLERAILGDGSW